MPATLERPKALPNSIKLFTTYWHTKLRPEEPLGTLICYICKYIPKLTQTESVDKDWRIFRYIPDEHRSIASMHPLSREGY